MIPKGLNGGKVRNSAFGKEGRGQGMDKGGIPTKNPHESQDSKVTIMTPCEKPSAPKIAKGEF
jgi:hypothetical protein